MRVAITGFIAQSIFGAENRFWGSRYANCGQLQGPKFSRDGFAPQWGKMLLRDAGFYSETRPQCAVSFGSSKGYAPFCGFDDARAYETDALQIARHGFVSSAVLCPVAACATGAHALALGAAMISRGQYELVLAGASEKLQPPEILAAYRNMGALSKSGVMRPFDTRRDGFLPSFGSAILLLESEARARNRGAEIHGFLTGYSLHCDAHHMTSMCPSGDSIARAIENALNMAGNPQIDYINAHGTATVNDAIETRAIKSVFGTSVPISSTKPLTGHLLGAAGAIEAVICLGAMRDGFAPPTLNLEETDLEADFVRGEARKIEIGTCLSLSYGFGGHIGVLVLEKS
ncbi:MAG TPA: beta-ketoacyl-[acyl-carrier-protein] synthase family protein [Abditibacterium sp.]|jgi:3-oxoacyl-(acyl-carrier-protein) synthase